MMQKIKKNLESKLSKKYNADFKLRVVESNKMAKKFEVKIGENTWVDAKAHFQIPIKAPKKFKSIIFDQITAMVEKGGNS